jgi:hypothetical protein
MKLDDFFLLEPDDVDFKSLGMELLEEVVRTDFYGDSRMRITALGELSRRAYKDEIARSIVLELTKWLTGMRDVAPHLYAYALSVCYWQDYRSGVPVIVRIAEVCDEVVLWDIVDLLSPDLQLYHGELGFREAAVIVARRLREMAKVHELPFEGHNYLSQFQEWISGGT